MLVPARAPSRGGAIDTRYWLSETPLEEHGQRTEWNVRDADGEGE